MKKTLNSKMVNRLLSFFGFTTVAAALLCLCMQDAFAADISGKMVDRSATLEEAMPPASERELKTVADLSGLTISEVKEFREAVSAMPATEPQVKLAVKDESRTALFQSGRAELSADVQKRIEAFAAQLKGKRNIRISVVGHTDSEHIGAHLKATYPSNKELSEARAMSVATALKKSLAADNPVIAAEGKGESMPVASNDSMEGMAQNRRVEIRAWFEDVAEPGPASKPVTTYIDKKETKTTPMCGSGGAPVPDVPFRISIDGKPTDGPDARSEADRERCVDVALEKTDIRVHFDPMTARAALNVWTAPNGALRNSPIHFYTYTNYVFWIRKAEVRIFEKGQNSQQRPLAVIPVKPNESAVWNAPEKAPDKLYFLLRVYDEQGRFDETAAKELTLLARRSPLSDEEKPERERLIGYGENSRVISNIPVQGGIITVDGSKIKTDQTVTVLGIPTPVDKNGKFACKQIMPAGLNAVDVNVEGADGARTVFRRNIDIPNNDWFYMGIADLTIGHNSISGPIELVTADNENYEKKTYVDGRGAFYVKGKIKDEYLLTMSADTRERPVGDLLRNFDSKDPHYLLRRLDPDQFYPVYGDDSTIVDDAPTQGKFYVKVEKNDSSLMWGNFQTQWTGTELTQYSRGLYGANLVLMPQGSTKYGERSTTVNAFAAEPGTLSSREEFRGTGGSLYYLHHMDITQGSERVWVEIRDKDSYMVIDRRQLAPSQDYDINYLQGRIMLRGPLPSVADGSTLVQTSTLNGNPVFLVATYEYEPGLTATNDLAAGLRASHWFGDHFRLGITGYRQGEDQSAQRLYGADATIRYKPGTYLKGEFGHSEGAGNGELTSITGGFDFNNRAGSTDHANAWRLEGAVDIAEIADGHKGKIAAYWQDRGRGFSGPGQTVFDTEKLQQEGITASVPVGPTTTVNVKADLRESDSQSYKAAEAGASQVLNREFTVSAGVRSDSRDVKTPNASQILSQNGERTDAIVRVDYRPIAKQADGSAVIPKNASGEGAQKGQEAGQADTGKTKVEQPVNTAALPVVQYEPWNLYGFAQGTLSHSEDRSQNNRIGVGGGWQVTPRFKMGAEVSEGDGGLGGKLSGDYRIDDRSNVYMTYTNETEQPDLIYRGRLGTLVLGSDYRLSDQTRLYSESRWVNGAGPDSMVQAFGLDYAPNDRWTYGFKGEAGVVSDEASGDLKRRAAGLSVAYKFKDLKYASALEYRHESGNIENRDTWLMRNSLGYQATPSWRLLGKLNFSFSDSSQGNFYDGNFAEFVTGAAYRPVNNDKLNALFKYTYFMNVPSPGQVTASNLMADYSQRSHVLSVDTIYDLVPWLSVGVKYGLRIGELRATKVEGEWFSSRADLWVLRADLHLVREWDAVVEGRRLKVYEADDARSGFLFAIYRHINNNVKLGVGYNFTNYSDDLTDLSYRSRGFFVNMVAKM
ncbi:MAG TPA: OmpA family protein [Dissulfurispiraceae bacterium]|nr:OmpA family protein [Dissulfurispiraceae bacterium]